MSAANDLFSMDDFARLPKIDAHVHLNSGAPTLLDQATADGFELVTINVDYPHFPPIEEQLRIARHNQRERRELLAYFATFSMSGWDTTEWQADVIAGLERAFADGAAGIKIWKNIGMDFRDHSGRLIMLDDPAFSPIFHCITHHNRILMGHQGEPYNCWLPIAEMSVNSDKTYFQRFPQYHMYLQPQMPSHERHIQVRNRVLHEHPRMRFIGAHLASLEWSLTELATFLDRFPTAMVDLAARMGQVQAQSNRDPHQAREFFIKYHDRVLYGSDLTQDADADANDVRREAHERWVMDWRYFTTTDSQRVPELDTPVRGIALPRQVISNIFCENARRCLRPRN